MSLLLSHDTIQFFALNIDRTSNTLHIGVTICSETYMLNPVTPKVFVSETEPRPDIVILVHGYLTLILEMTI